MVSFLFRFLIGVVQPYQQRIPVSNKISGYEVPGRTLFLIDLQHGLPVRVAIEVIDHQRDLDREAQDIALTNLTGILVELIHTPVIGLAEGQLAGLEAIGILASLVHAHGILNRSSGHSTNICAKIDIVAPGDRREIARIPYEVRIYRHAIPERRRFPCLGKVHLSGVGGHDSLVQVRVIRHGQPAPAAVLPESGNEARLGIRLDQSCLISRNNQGPVRDVHSHCAQGQRPDLKDAPV